MSDTTEEQKPDPEVCDVWTGEGWIKLADLAQRVAAILAQPEDPPPPDPIP